MSEETPTTQNTTTQNTTTENTTPETATPEIKMTENNGQATTTGTRPATETSTTETRGTETTTEAKPGETTETKAGEETKGAETKADAPADYTRLALPEGYKADDPVFADAVKLFGDQKIAPEVAQKLIDFTVERDKAIAKAVNDSTAANWTRQTGEWKESLRKGVLRRGPGRRQDGARPGLRQGNRDLPGEHGVHQPPRPHPRNGQGLAGDQGQLVRAAAMPAAGTARRIPSPSTRTPSTTRNPDTWLLFP